MKAKAREKAKQAIRDKLQDIFVMIYVQDLWNDVEPFKVIDRENGGEMRGVFIDVPENRQPEFMAKALAREAIYAGMSLEEAQRLLTEAFEEAREALP